MPMTPTDISPLLLQHGAVNSFVGTLTSRTLMFAELSALLEAVADESMTQLQMQALVIEANVCGKNSLVTRQKTFRHLRELYGLSGDVTLWKAFHFLWRKSPDERQLLALLLASAREPILRLTWNFISQYTLHQTILPTEIDAFVEEHQPGRYQPKTRVSLGKNVASAWAQSGHLTSTSPKQRKRARGGPASATFALYLGHLEGLSPESCFDTRWVSLLDAPSHQIDEWAFEAHKYGWIDYRRIENVVQLDFTRLEKLSSIQ